MAEELLAGGGEKKKYDLIPGNSEAVEFDGKDIRLLSALSDNARIPLVELARKAGLSATAARRRLVNLGRKKVILGFRPKIDLAKIGYYWYKVEFRLEDNTKKAAMLSYFGSHPDVVYAYEGIGGGIGGGAELEVEMEVESHEKFREVVDGMRAKFRDAIRTYVYYLWSAEHKIIFFPKKEFFGKS